MEIQAVKVGCECSAANLMIRKLVKRSDRAGARQYRGADINRPVKPPTIGWSIDTPKIRPEAPKNHTVFLLTILDVAT